MGYENTLIYKRTHTGDPKESGIFGCNDCMGSIRGWKFDAVIGVGGKKPQKGHEDIALKINWIGLDPTKRDEVGKKGPLVTFKHFHLYDEKGPGLKKLAPKFFKYMFDKNVRAVTSRSLTDNMQNEITKILRLAKQCPKSKGLSSRKASRGKCQ